MGPIKNRHQLRVILSYGPQRRRQQPSTVQWCIKAQRTGTHTCILLSAISVSFCIFEADSRLALTTSFSIDSKPCSGVVVNFLQFRNHADYSPLLPPWSDPRETANPLQRVSESSSSSSSSWMVVWSSSRTARTRRNGKRHLFGFVDPSA